MLTNSSFTPNLFILGAAKCGTTTLHSYLSDLPDVCMSQPKEPFFFESEYSQGLDFYLQKYFSHWKGESIVGEARQRNIYLPYVPLRIHATSPNAKLIVIVRNPVERAFSNWYHEWSRKRDPLDFPMALRADLTRIEKGLRTETEDGFIEYWRMYQENGFLHMHGDKPYRTYLDSGYYFEQIARYLQLYPSESLKVILFEDLTAKPAEVIGEMVAFLGLDAAKNYIVRERRENAALPPARQEPPSWMVSFYRLSGLKLLLTHSMRERIKQFVYNKIVYKPRIAWRTRKWLRDHYRIHNKRLEDFLGRDLSSWI